EKAIQGGITAFQFREKGAGSLTGMAKIALGKQLRNICLEHRIRFFINDDIDLADSLYVDGFNVGLYDMQIDEIKKLYPNKIIGISISNRKELNQSPVDLIDYIGAGAVFPTSTKKDAKEAVGLEWIKILRSEYPDLPIVGIGGINADNAYSVREAGADGISVISAITEAENIKEVVRRL